MLREGMEAIRPVRRPNEFDTATIGALAHLYRGEIYRSTIWRTRLDNTTNWAVVTLGIALSVTFSSQESSRNYIWILGIQTIAYYGKIAIHPVPVSSLSELVQRASLGPIPGGLMILAGILFTGGWVAFATITWFLDRAKHGPGPRVTMG